MDVLNSKEEDELLKDIKHSEIIEKESSLSWDGVNLITRIPKEIADYLKINMDNRFDKSIVFKIEDKDGIITKGFDIIDRTKPKKKNGQTKKTNQQK
jgi:hypothetical protein